MIPLNPLLLFLEKGLDDFTRFFVGTEVYIRDLFFGFQIRPLDLVKKVSRIIFENQGEEEGFCGHFLPGNEI